MQRSLASDGSRCILGGDETVDILSHSRRELALGLGEEYGGVAALKKINRGLLSDEIGRCQVHGIGEDPLLNLLCRIE